MSVTVTTLFDKETYSVTHLLIDTETCETAVINPALNYEKNSATVSFTSAKEVLPLIKTKKLSLKWFLETQVHVALI